ncbi:hypothetical protein F511_21678 [Dorcoceras hygrometricum]|uniref:Uncharacterized protein n=1 Tax=Dorcoceras hygrometricum TaxID=472368 RepID=A0A2Z7BDX2_9LAMI|nr:hypothetical protein F511_21678 [Dorcoceras hygrometricum]
MRRRFENFARSADVLSAVRFNREFGLVLYYCSRHIEIFPDSKLCRDTLVAVHRTLSSSIADGRQLRLNLRLLPSSSCIASAFYLLLSIAVFQFLSVLRFEPDVLWGLCCCLYVVSGFPGFSVGRGFDPAGGAPSGG